MLYRRDEDVRLLQDQLATLLVDFHLLKGVRATLLFSSQHAAERLLALTNPCWSLPIGCSLVHRGQIKSTITLHPAKGEDMATSATTTSLVGLIEEIPKCRN